MDLLDPLVDPDGWDQLISMHAGASAFHGAAWARVLNRTYGHKPTYLRFNGEVGAPPSLIPLMEVSSPVTGRRAISVPFSDLCSPLLAEGCDPVNVRDRLAAITRERRWKYLELRGGELSEKVASNSPTFLGHQLDLTIGTDSLLAACASSVRRALNKSARSGLTVRIGHSEADMREFYRLHTRTRRRHGLPPQPYRFFQHIHHEQISNQSGFIVSASLSNQDKPIAAAVFLTFGDTAIYKFGASDERHWHLRPNHLVVWEGIRYLVDSGKKQLHLGRTSPGDAGLRRFKLTWGAREMPIYYTQFHAKSGKWMQKFASSRLLSQTFANKVFSHSPLALNRLMGNLICPHLD